jgi:hypothetical protein
MLCGIVFPFYFAVVEGTSSVEKILYAALATFEAGPPNLAPPKSSLAAMIPFSAKEHNLSLDIKTLVSIPHQQDRPCRALQAVVTEHGKCLHSEKSPGAMVISGTASVITPFCKVHFISATKRNPELLVGFCDYGMANIEGQGISVESIPLPLKVKQNNYQRDLYTTEMEKIAGFEQVDLTQIPWSTDLAPCLKGLREASWLEDARITGPAAALHWVNQPMEAKLTRLEMQGTRLIELETEKLVQQDSRSGNQARQLYVARLKKNVHDFKSLPIGNYNREIDERMILLSDVSGTAKPEWLTTPMQKKLEEGTAEHVSTTIRGAQPLRLDFGQAGTSTAMPAAAPAAAEVEEEEEGEGEATVLRPSLSESDGESEEESPQPVDGSPVAAPLPAAKRRRNSTVRYEAGPAQGKGKQRAAKGKGANSQAAAPAAATSAAKPGRGPGGMPMKYRKKDPAARALEAAARPAARRVAQPTAAQRTRCSPRKGSAADVQSAQLQAENAALRAQLQTLQEQLAAEQADRRAAEDARRAAEDARRAAEAAGAQAKYEAYKEGVTAGSCLSRGVAPPGAGPA